MYKKGLRYSLEIHTCNRRNLSRTGIENNDFEYLPIRTIRNLTNILKFMIHKFM